MSSLTPVLFWLQPEPSEMAAPTMKERQACWGARDEYWRCLDEHTEDASRCEKLRSSFESSCPQQWVRRTRARLALSPRVGLGVCGRRWRRRAPREGV